MERKLKLIWDFRGEASEETARHHAKHLTEYIQIEKLDDVHAGHELYHPAHAIAYMVVPESMMPRVRDALRPQRGELWQEHR